MTTPTVKVIDKRSVHQICSGQVVVTLATAVKELVENSLDAEATNIEVRLKNWGADSLEVVDNGSGVLPENFAALALKHHTSKLSMFSDLVGVETFGFRGEALSSLCALGNLSISTCHKSQNIGARIEYNHDGHITKQHATARTSGTTVTLLNLFSTLPVRHKEFLRNIKREYTKLVQVLQGYCVISTGVRISCYTIGEKGKKSLALATNGSNDMRENISNVFGPKQLQTILEFKQINPTTEDCEELGLEASPFELNSPVLCLTGFASRCDHGAGRSANDRQYVFINKRPCDMPKLTRLVNEVYHVFNRNQYPFLVLNIDLSKDLVDVNVTPDKRQVFLQQEKLLFATVKSSLKAMYDPGTSTYETNQKPLTQIKLPFTNRKNEEDGNTTEFSMSIKNRLLLAANVSKKKQASSILKFATKRDNVLQQVEKNVDVTSKCKVGNAVLNISNLKQGNFVDSRSAEITLDSEIPASSEDELPMANVSANDKEDKQDVLLVSSISEANEEETANADNSSSSTVANRNLAFKPKEDDLCTTYGDVGVYRIDGGSDKSEDPCNSPVINGYLTHSSKQNRERSTEICLPEHSTSCLVGKDEEISQECNVEKFSNVNSVSEDFIQTRKQENNELRKSVGENIDIFESEYPAYEGVNMDGKDLSGIGKLKRRRNDQNEASEIHCCNKKVRLDEEYENENERQTRKNIVVNFDLRKLREKLTTGNSTKNPEGTLGYARTFRATIAPENNKRAEEELERHITKQMFGRMKIIGQFNQGFIITKLEEDLFIVDQHASDEKYNFEDQQKNTVIKSQRLICPQSLDLTVVNESVLMDNLEVFRKNGFDFEIDTEAPVSKRVKLVSSPVSRNWSFGKSDIDELIFMLSDSPGVNYRPSNIRKMFASRACRMSVMVGTALNDGQMKRIVGHMGEMEHPWNCPHGRPTMRHLVNLNMVRK